MDEIEFFSREERKLKAKQERCNHTITKDNCIHPSSVCLLCGIHVDNMGDGAACKNANLCVTVEEQRKEIEHLNDVISEYELMTQTNRDEVINTPNNGVF